MKKTYKIEVDCANCANKMEDATKKTEGVANATVNFMTQKMIVEFAEGADEKAAPDRKTRTARNAPPGGERRTAGGESPVPQRSRGAGRGGIPYRH